MSRLYSGRSLAHGLAYVLLLGSSACVTGAASQTPFSPRGDARSEIEVRNQLFDDVTVYAVTQDGAARRLGVVSGFDRRTFRLPFGWLGSTPIQLHARSLASRVSHDSNALLLQTGQRASWVIETNPALSGATLRLLP